MLDDRFALPLLDRLDGPVPPARILSGGRYTVLITGAGTGLSTCDGRAINAWSGDRIEDTDGFVVYVRDPGDRTFRSIGARPAGGGARRYTAGWEPGSFQITREDDGLETRLEIFVAPGEPAEVRRVSIKEMAGRRRHVEITSCIEPVLNDRLAHIAHPAFSKLFLQTEIVPERRGLLLTRRPRANVETPPWAIHALIGDGAAAYETDRERFVGRARPAGAPRGMAGGEPLTANAGCMIEPVLVLRSAAEIPPHGTAERTFLLGVAATRDEALGVADRLGTPGAVDLALEGAKGLARAMLRDLGIDEARAAYDQALAGAVLYAHPALRAPSETLARVRLPRERLGAYGLSPHRPYVVVHATAPAAAEMARTARHWRALGLPVDVALIAEGPVPASWAGPAEGPAPGTGGAGAPKPAPGTSAAGAPKPPPGTAGAGEPGFITLQAAELAPEALDLIEAGARLLVRGSMPDLTTDPRRVPGMR